MRGLTVIVLFITKKGTQIPVFTEIVSLGCRNQGKKFEIEVQVSIAQFRYIKILTWLRGLGEENKRNRIEDER